MRKKEYLKRVYNAKREGKLSPLHVRHDGEEVCRSRNWGHCLEHGPVRSLARHNRRHHHGL